MPWWFRTIFWALLAWFVLGFLLGLLIWWWRRRQETAEAERARLESEAESDRLRLRINSLKDSEERATQLAGQVSELEGRVATLQGDAERASELELELAELRAKADSLTDLETQVVSLRAEADSAAALDAQLRSTRIELEEARDRANRLEIDLSEAQNTAVDADGLQAEVDGLRAELATAKADAEARIADLDACRDQVAELQRQLEAAIDSTSSADEEIPLAPAVADEVEPEPAETPGDDAEAEDGEDEVEETVAAETPSWQVGTTALGTPGADHRDDLKAINGIGPVMERTLNGLGIQSWEQIAALTEDDVERVSEAIQTFPGRITRDDWIGGATELLVDHVPGEDTSRKRSSNRRRRRS